MTTYEEARFKNQNCWYNNNDNVHNSNSDYNNNNLLNVVLTMCQPTTHLILTIVTAVYYCQHFTAGWMKVCKSKATQLLIPRAGFTRRSLRKGLEVTHTQVPDCKLSRFLPHCALLFVVQTLHDLLDSLVSHPLLYSSLLPSKTSGLGRQELCHLPRNFPVSKLLSSLVMISRSRQFKEIQWKLWRLLSCTRNKLLHT